MTAKPVTKQQSTTVPEQEPVAFVADARLISVLGEQLIGSEKVGVLELVKNAYDARASSCVVTLDGVPSLAPEGRILSEYAHLPGPIIEIRDDGTGMTKTDLIEGWLRPATSRRARVKEQLRLERHAARERGTLSSYNALVRQLREAHGGRLPIGEKGVGRLATHRLGSHLWLRTKTADDPLEWELQIDWERFDSLTGENLVDLSDVKLTLRHQPTTTSYGPRNSGTVLCCYAGRPGYSWDRDAIIDVGRAVNALRSPYKTPSGFAPRFVTPHVSEEELASPLERVPAPFELLALIDEKGMADVDLTFRPPASMDIPLEPFRLQERKDLRSREKDAWKSNGHLREPTCGPFLVHVRAWIRMRDWMGADYISLTTYLDEFGGLTVYRDGLAALPAQQSAKGDWLGLALEQIKKSSNISYYHLSGEIEIAQENSLELRDRSSREGMIETAPYRDFVTLTRAVIDELQFYMQQERTRWSRLGKGERIPLRTIGADAKMAAKIGDLLVERYDFHRDSLGLKKISGGERAADFLAELSHRLKRLADQLKFQQEEREGLLDSAGFGLAVGVALHEIARLATAVSDDLRGLRSLGRATSSADLERVEQRAMALLNEVQRLAPLRVTRAEPTRAMSIRSAIESARAAFAFTMEKQGVNCSIEGGDLEIRARFGAMAQVFANLLDNALYWLGTQGTGGTIRIVVSEAKRTVLFADSGPGISRRMLKHVFQPFFSERTPPSGLGLFICRHYLGQAGAAIRLAQDSERTDTPGAQFLLSFPRPSED